MRYLIGGVLAALTFVLAIGAIGGRVRIRSCCAVADPTRDLRMRGAATTMPTDRHVEPSGPATADTGWVMHAGGEKDRPDDGARRRPTTSRGESARVSGDLTRLDALIKDDRVSRRQQERDPH